jgi:hypothetical protein
MSTAILKIDGDTSGLARAFGDMRAQAKATETAIKSSFDKATAAMGAAAQRAEGVYRRSGRAIRDDSAKVAQQQERDAQRTVAAFLRAEDQKRRAAQLTAKARERAEQEATNVARAEAQKRGLTAEQEARLRQSTLERVTRAQEAAERRQTATVQREARERAKMMATVSRGANHVVTAGFGAAREAHGQIQDARRQRAESEHTLNAAFFQAGVSVPEATRMTARIQQEIASGSLRGLSMEQFAGGLLGAQVQSSVMTGATEADRSTNLNRQIELAAFARNTFQDPAEVMRVAGMLSQQGVTGGDQMDVLRSLTGMAQAGSIELSTLTSTALGPLMQNISRTTNQNQTAAQRSEAVRRTTAETMAIGEIGAAAGLTPRDALNAMAKLRTSVENPMMAERLDARLRASGRGELAGQLVQRNAAGALELRNRNPVEFMSSLVQGMGGDTNAVTNLLSAGGRGSAMVLDSQQRRLINAMSSQTSGGQTIAQHITEMQGAGTRFGIGDVERGRQLVEGEQRTELQSAEETRLGALTDNTSAMVNLSNAINNWTTRNPIASSALQSGGGLLGGALGGALFPRIGQAIVSTGIGARLAGLAGASGGGGGILASLGSVGAFLGTSVGAASASTIGAIVAGSLGAGAGLGTLANRAIYSDAGQRGGNAAYTNVFTGDFWRGFTTSVSQAITDGMGRATVNATVSPVDATHAAAQAPVTR